MLSVQEFVQSQKSIRDEERLFALAAACRRPRGGVASDALCDVVLALLLPPALACTGGKMHSGCGVGCQRVESNIVPGACRDYDVVGSAGTEKFRWSGRLRR